MSQEVKVYNIENFAITAADTKELLTNVVMESDFVKLEARCKELEATIKRKAGNINKLEDSLNICYEKLEESKSENRILKAKLEKATDFVKYISNQGWWSTKMNAKQYSAILDEYKIESDNALKELDSITIDSIKRGEK